MVPIKFHILSVAGCMYTTRLGTFPFLVVSLSRLLPGFRQACEDEKSSKLVSKVFFCSDNNLMSTGLHDRLQLQQRSGNELQALDDQDLAKVRPPFLPPSSCQILSLRAKLSNQILILCVKQWNLAVGCNLKMLLSLFIFYMWLTRWLASFYISS